MGDINQPSEAELDILNIIWRKHPVTVREVHELLMETKQVGYTTTLKQIQRHKNNPKLCYIIEVIVAKCLSMV